MPKYLALIDSTSADAPAHRGDIDFSQEPHQAEKESQHRPDDPAQPIGHDREDRPMPERRKTDATAGWIGCATATSENSSTKCIRMSHPNDLSLGLLFFFNSTRRSLQQG